MHGTCCAYSALKVDKSIGSLAPVERTPAAFEYHYVNFTLTYRNPAFSKFELAFKYLFIVVAVGALAAFWSAGDDPNGMGV